MEEQTTLEVKLDLAELIEVTILNDSITTVIQNPWKCPHLFNKMMTPEVERYNDEYVEAEIGGLKRICQWAIGQGLDSLKFNPLSILVCLENLQRYYTRK